MNGPWLEKSLLFRTIVINIEVCTNCCPAMSKVKCWSWFEFGHSTQLLHTQILLQSVVHMKPETGSDVKREIEKFKCCIFFQLCTLDHHCIRWSCFSEPPVLMSERSEWKMSDDPSSILFEAYWHNQCDMYNPESELESELKTWQDLRLRWSCG